MAVRFGSADLYVLPAAKLERVVGPTPGLQTGGEEKRDAKQHYAALKITEDGLDILRIHTEGSPEPQITYPSGLSNHLERVPPSQAYQEDDLRDLVRKVVPPKVSLTPHAEASVQEIDPNTLVEAFNGEAVTAKLGLLPPHSNPFVVWVSHKPLTPS